MKRTVLTIFIALAILITVPVASLAGMGGGSLLTAGTEAPDFTFKDLDGKEDSLYAHKVGEPLLLVFIQRTCRSCQREMDFLKQLSDENDSINVLGVFVDAVDRDFKKFIEEKGLPFRFFWDAEYEIGDKYGVSFTPTSYLLDKNRVISKVYRGWSRKGEKLAEDIKVLEAN